MANKIGIVLALDGEKEFSQGLKTASEAAKTAQKQLKELDSEYSGSANTVEALRAKQEALADAQEKYNTKLNAAQSGLDHANTNLEKCTEKYEDLKKQVEEARKALEDMEKSGQTGTTAYAQQAEQVEKLEKALSDQSVQCGKAEQTVESYKGKVATAQTELNNMNQAVEQNGQYLAEAESSVDGCATSIDEYGNEVKDAETVTTSWSDKLKQAFANAAVTAGMKALRQGMRELVQAFKEMVSVGSEFEASMSNVSAVSGATGSSLDSLSAKAQELGSSTKFTATEVADAFSYMALAGWDTEQMLDGISGVLDLAAASGMELAEASDMVTDYLSAFSMEASEATTVADMLAYAQANSNTTAEQLGEAYGNCAASLNAAGQDIETVTALLEAMANQGEKGASAGTALNAVMRDISNNMEDGAIKIGDTTVQVADQAGNFRDLTDIIADVEAATDGLGTAETRVALSSTFTSRSMSAMNLILNEGSDAISDYEDALRSADGAAADMADTMQDNLQGDMTKLNSALEGLGIAIYDYFEGPLRGATQVATTVISGLTDTLKQSENAAAEMVSSTRTAADQLISTQQASNAVVSEAQASAKQLTATGENLIRLNSIEDKTVSQKQMMSSIVGELSASIPELAAAFDEETGSLNLTDEAIRKLIESESQLELISGMESSLDNEMQALSDATLAYEEALMNLEALQERADFWSSFDTGAEDAVDRLKAAFDDGLVTIDEYQAAMEAIADAGWTTSILGFSGQYTTAVQQQEEEVKRLGDALEETQDSYDSTAEAIDEYTESQEKAAIVAEEAVNRSLKMNAVEEEGTNIATHNREERDNFTASIDEATGEVVTLTKAEDDLSDTESALSDEIDDTVESLDDLRASASEVQEAMGTAYTDTFNSVIDAYNSTKEALAAGIDIDFRTEFNGGADETVESMLATAQENTQALQNYEKNLQEVSSHLGNEIAPEFLQYLMDLGTDGANTLDHISKTFEQDNGSELVKQWSDEFLAQMEIQDQIADEFTALKFALDNGLDNLGSTDVEWEGLQQSFESAIGIVEQFGGEVTEETQAAFQEAAAAAQSAGVAIPDGLADGLESGQYSVEDATQILNQAMQGQFDALASLAEEQGIEVSDSLSAGVEQGGQAAADAINTLIEEMTGAAEAGASEIESAEQSAIDAAQAGVDTGTAGQEIGSEITEDIAEGAEEGGNEVQSTVQGVVDDAVQSVDVSGLEEVGQQAVEAFNTGVASGDSTEAVETMVESAAAALEGESGEYESAGSEAGTAYGSGVESTSGEVESQAQSVAQAGVSGMDAEEGSYTNSGDTAGSNYASGIASEASSASAAAASCAEAALASANSYYSSFYSAGANMSAGIAAGINSGASGAINAAISVANQALSAAKSALGISSPSKKFKKEVGEMISEGTALGIESKAATAADAADSMSNTVYKNATSWLSKYKKSHNVSLSDEKYYWQQMIKQCKEGTTGYSKAVAKLMKVEVRRSDYDTAAEYYDAMYDYASDYLEKREVLNSWSLKEEMNYWTQIQKQLKKGTDAWYEAQKQINSIAANMGSIDDDTLSRAQTTLNHIKTMNDMSIDAEIAYWESIKSGLTKYSDAWYEVTDTINTLKEQNANAANELYDQIIEAASTYVDQQTTLDNMSLSEQLAYWEQIQKEVKKGTDAWYNAQKQINSIQSKIGTVSNMNSLLNAYTTYYDVSAKAEMQYWDTVRMQYEEGTDARLEADQKYFEAKQEYTEALEDLEDDYLDKVQSVNKQLESDIKNLTDSYNSAVESRTQELKNAYGLFDEFTSESVSGQELLYNMQTQAAGYEAWDEALQELSDRGILSDELLEELTDQGPDQLAAIYALSDLTDEELTAYQEAFDRKMTAIQNQVDVEMADLLEETERQTEELKAQAEADLADLEAEYDANVAAINENISSELQLLADNTANIAEDSTAAIVAAVEGGVDSLKGYFNEQSAAAKTASSAASSTASSTTASSSSSSSGISASEVTKILEIINSGTSKTSLTAKQRSNHSSLYCYLVDNYQRGCKTSIEKQLAKQLGVDTSQSNWKSKTLTALQKKGFREGGVPDDEFAWMDEELDSIGPEFVVSRSDNALLTRLPAHSEIIDAGTTDRLLQLAQMDPQSLVTTVAKQQNAIMDMASGMSNGSELNELTNVPVIEPVPSVSTEGMEDMLYDMYDLLSQYIPMIGEPRQIGFDRDQMVEQLADGMSNNFAMRSRRMRA